MKVLLFAIFSLAPLLGCVAEQCGRQTGGGALCPGGLCCSQWGYCRTAPDVITGQWTPSNADEVAGRLPGYGLLTNIINGGIECGWDGPLPQVVDRIGFYKRYCDMLGVSPGDNLDCDQQTPFGSGLMSEM